MNITVLAALSKTGDQAEIQRIKDAHAALQHQLSTQSSSQAVLEALVICAESAIKSHNLDVAKKSLETYFLEARRYGNGLAAAEVRDQFLVRAHYATALLVSALSKGAKGAAVIEGTLEAIKHLMRGMEVAVANPRYTFLVYNGSVHHWHVARPLMRESLRTVLLPSMERVVAALERVPGQEAWKVRNLMNLALVQSEAGKAAEAASSLARGYAMARGAAAPPLPELIKEVARLQASRPRANLGPVSRAGWAAAVVGLPELAEKWAGRAAASQSSGPRNWSALTRVLLSLQALGGSDNTLTRPVILVHTRALEALEDIVATFMKLGCVDGTHEAARLIWNASLLLLQPELRRHVKRAMNAAARALEVIDSPLHRLRAQLHLEAAKCDAMEDSLIKASQEVARAIGLDYPVSPREQAAHQLERPLDRFLLPLADTLALRMGAKEPDGVEQEALSMIERSKESRSPAIKTDLLRRALEKLSSLPLQPPPPPSTPPPGPARAAAHLRARRRTAGWSELVKSAWSGGPAARSEELVLAAAPWALAGEWDAGVDREMVLLQGQVSYLEAEACVSMLKKMRREVVPPLQPPPLLQPPPGGLRPPALKPEEFQSTLIAAILRGMRAGLAISEPWLVVNGAVLTWNSYLPVMQQYRYAELSPVLTPVVDLLLRLDIPSSDGLLAVGLTEALAKSREHALLLTLLLPPPAPGRGEDGDDGEEGGPAGEAGRAAGYAGPAFRSGVTAGYEPLPSARVKAGSQDPRSHPRTKRLMATLPSIAASCEQALARAGTAQSQSLFEAYARLQQLRGLPVAIPAGTAATSEQTSKVVGIIEAVLRSTSPTHASADIRAAMAILAALPTVNVELWAKLGRAAAGAQLYPLALECATSATRLLPEGQSLSSVTVATDLPLLPPNAWFWLAVAELTHGQIPSMLTVTCISPFCTQGWLNCLRVECLASRGEWSEALAALDGGVRAMWPKSSHRPLLAWRALCLAKLGRNVPAEMQKVKEYGPETQSFMWSVLGHHSETHYDQLTSAYKALDAVAKVAWVKAEYLVNYAEWLISSGLNDGELAEDALLAAADALLEFDVGEVEEEVEVEEVDPTGRSIGSKMGRRSARRPSTAPRPVSGKRGASARPHSSAPVEEAAQPDDCAPDSLSTNYLERLLRIYLMLALAADNAADHCDYLLTAQHYGVRILQSAMFSAIHMAQLKVGNGLVRHRRPPLRQHPGHDGRLGHLHLLPRADGPAAGGQRGGGGAPLALNTASLQQPERTLAYLRLLAESLGKRGYDVQVLPLMQLARLVAQLVVKSEVGVGVGGGFLLSVCWVGAGLPGHERVSKQAGGLAGDYTAITPAEEAAAAEDAAAHAVTRAAADAAARARAGRPRTTTPATGRLSFLAKMRQMGGVGAAAAADAVERAGGGGGGSGEGPGSEGTASATVTLTDVDGGGGGAGPGSGVAPDWLVASAAEMLSGGGEPTSGGLMVGARGLLVLRPLSVHDVWLVKGRALIARGHYGSGKALLLRAREHAWGAYSHGLIIEPCALTLTQQAIAALAAREAGIPHVEALLLQAELLSADPAPARDVRPRLKKVERVLLNAEEMAARFQSECVPRDLDPAVVVPVSRLLARTRLALAELQLLQAAARDANRAADQARLRPKYPRMKGREDEVVVHYIDSISAAPATTVMQPEDSALALAASAAQLSAAPADRSRAHMLEGRCLLFKFLALAPSSIHPWPTPTPAASAASSDQQQQQQVIMLLLFVVDAQQLQQQPGAPGRQRGGGDGEGGACGGSDGEGEAGGRAAEAAALSVKRWAVASFEMALEVSLGQQFWLTAELTALELARCYGKMEPQVGASAVLGSPGGGPDDFVASPPQHSPPTLGPSHPLTWHLTSPSPKPCQTSTPNVKLQDHPQSSPPPHTHTPPPLLLHTPVVAQTPHSAHPEHRSSLRTAVLVMAPWWDVRSCIMHPLSRSSPPPSGRRPAAGTSCSHRASRPPRTCRSCWRPPPPQQAEALALQVRAQLGDTLVAPTDCGHYQKVRQLLSTLGTTAPQLDLAAAPPIPDILASLPQDLRILALYLAPDKCTLYMAAINVPNPDAPPPLPPAPLAGRREAAVTPPPAAVDASGSPVPSTVTLVERGHLKSDALERLVARLRAYRRQMEDLLEPWMPLLRSAFPAPPTDPPAAPAGMTPSPAASTGRKEAAPVFVKHKVVLLLDPALASLPFEALPWFRATASSLSRAPSLHLLHAASAPLRDAPPTDLTSTAYIVDPRSQCSTPLQARGGHAAALGTTRALLAEPDGRLWIGTENGLYLRKVDGTLKRVAIDPTFLGDASKIWRIDGGRAESNRSDVTQPDSRQDEVRVAMEGGLLMIGGDLVARPFAPAALSSLRVMSSARDTHGRLWIATVSGMLLEESNGSLQTINGQPLLPGGLPSDKIWQLLLDREAICSRAAASFV
ncbi:MAG: hypothetical protein WDW38_010242 [Sanguina aurantia]